jgi:hypothetical protein
MELESGTQTAVDSTLDAGEGKTNQLLVKVITIPSITILQHNRKSQIKYRSDRYNAAKHADVRLRSLLNGVGGILEGLSGMRRGRFFSAQREVSPWTQKAGKMR